MYISIEGNIGSGKSTVWDALQSNHANWTFVKEPVDLWTMPGPSGKSMLALFYEDLARNAQPFQMQALSTRTRCLQDGLKLGGTVVSERSPLTDKCIFYKMNEAAFSECERSAQETVYANLNIKEPDLVVQLKCDPDVCMQRIRKRNRDGEHMSLDQLIQLHNLHEDMAKRSNIAVVSSQDDIDVVVANVEKAIQVFASPRNILQSA